MSNLLSSLSSSGGLVLIGVAVLAVVMVVLAIWLVVVTVRLGKERAWAELLDQRVAHIEEYLTKTTKHTALAPEAEGEAPDVAKAPKPGAKPAGGVVPVMGAKQRKEPARAADADARKPRRSKRQPVIPYGEAKPPADKARSAQAASAAHQAARMAPPEPLGRQSVTKDAKRRREERHQAEIRRQAESIVQKHRAAAPEE